MVKAVDYGPISKIKKKVDEYGFTCLEIITADGGTVTIVSFKGRDSSALGLFSTINPKGLGASTYLTNDNINYEKRKIETITWLNETEKMVIKSFLDEIAGEG